METKKSYQENGELLIRSLAGDERATERLLILNAGLVRGIAHRFIGRGTDLEDLIEIGTIGLLKAIRTFDPARECAFSTYAVPLIFGEIRRHLRDDGMIKVSRTQKRLAAKLAEARERALKAGESVRIADLASMCGVSEEEAVTALDAVTPVRSLSESVFGDGDGPTLDDVIADEDEVERTFDKLALSIAIGHLTEPERKIILLRYFRDLTQQETADLLGLSQVKVSREEKKILAKLRVEMQA